MGRAVLNAADGNFPPSNGIARSKSPAWFWAGVLRQLPDRNAVVKPPSPRPTKRGRRGADGLPTRQSPSTPIPLHPGSSGRREETGRNSTWTASARITVPQTAARPSPTEATRRSRRVESGFSRQAMRGATGAVRGRCRHQFAAGIAPLSDARAAGYAAPLHGQPPPEPQAAARHRYRAGVGQAMSTDFAGCAPRHRDAGVTRIERICGRRKLGAGASSAPGFGGCGLLRNAGYPDAVL